MSSKKRTQPVNVDFSTAPSIGRRDSIIRALRRLHQICPGPATIVETGTLRDDREIARQGDGWATLAWGWYAAQSGGKAVTVDLDPEAIKVCKRVTAEYAKSLEYVIADSVGYFEGRGNKGTKGTRGTKGPIHLLYLDSLDYVDKERSEEHSLAEVKAALPLLAPVCLVLFDDTRVCEDHESRTTRRNPPSTNAFLSHSPP